MEKTRCVLKIAKFARIAAVLASLACAALAQQTRVFQDGNNWVQEASGSIAAAKNLRVKTDFGSVRVTGGSQPGINYVFRNSASTSEDRARRQFENIHVSAYVRGDIAYITVEDARGSHNRCSGDFTINVPRPSGPRLCPARQRPVAARGRRTAGRGVARDKPGATPVVIPRY